MVNFPNFRAFLRAVKEGEVPIDSVLLATEACDALGVRRQSLDDAIARGHVDGWRAERLLFVDSRTVRAFKRKREAANA